MSDEIQVADTGASVASPEAAAPAETPVQATPEATGEQPQPVTFDETLFDGQEAEVPTEQAGQYDSLLQISPYIQDEQTLQNAIARQGTVEAVLQGQAPASALFEGMRTQNPEQWASLMNGVAEYLQQVSGLKLMDPAQAGGQQLTPEQQKIQQLEQQQQAWQQQQQQERQNQIVAQAQKQLTERLPELTKGRFIEGEKPEWIMGQLASKLAGKETQVIAAISKGDFTLVQKAIAQIAHEERIRFNQAGKRIAQQRNALKTAVPKTGTKGGADLVLPTDKIDTKDPNWFGKTATRIMTQ
jgi:hypothetical protein